MIRLLTVPMLVTSGLNLMLGLFFLALYRRLKLRHEQVVHHYFLFAILALVSGVFLGAFSVLMNSSSALARLDVSNRVTIVAATFNVLLAIHFYVDFFRYKPPVRLGWFYAINGVFVVLCAIPSRFFLAREFYRTSRYYVGLTFGVGFQIWGAWLAAMSAYALLVLCLIYWRTRHRSGETPQGPVLALIVVTATWLVTGLCDDLTAIQLIDLPPLTWIGSCLVSGCIAWLLVLEIDNLYDERRKLNVKLMRDHLTGAYSRGVFDLRLAETVEALRKGQIAGLCLCLFDIDDFKGINDRHGHAIGDEVLRAIARAAAHAVRASDCAARLGGDEFAVLLPGVARDPLGRSIVERIRETVANIEVEAAESKVPVSCSFGLVQAATEHASEAELASSLLKAADAALYASKRQGKNQVAVTSLPPPAAAERRSSRRISRRSVPVVE